jgi:hypothetical protein
MYSMVPFWGSKCVSTEKKESRMTGIYQGQDYG